MKKSTNKYRRCANCPHHSVNQQKCCCQRSSASRRNRPMTSRNKRELSTIDNSSVMNTTIPTIPTIIAQFSALRTENNHLKRELLNVSSFINNENCSNSANTDISLSEKLFLSNKNLKQALLQIDSLSKANKELCERNNRLSEQSQGLKIQLREVQDYLQKYKKRCKKLAKDQERQASKEDVEQIVQRNQDLEEEIKTLKDEVRCLKFENKNFNMVGTLSPEWVAHTGNKIRHQQFPTKCQEQLPNQQIQAWKKSLSETIHLLKVEGTHFDNVSMEPSKIEGLDVLLETLLQRYSQSILIHFQLLIKEMNRKISNYQKKVNNLASKLQNFVMVFRNKKMKKKNYGPLTLIKTDRTPVSELTNRLI